MPRRLGQHFLLRDSILATLAAAGCGEHVPRTIEIGPGRGALTRHLLHRTDELHAIELDEDLLPVLRKKFANEPKLHLHCGNVLTTDLSQWGPAAIVGNLPYYITSPIIQKFLSLGADFSRGVFLVQKEVADRLLASPGSRDYGFLTVAVQLVCDVNLLCSVPAAAFSPPSKVDSAGVRLTRKAANREIPARLLEFVGRCFAHKRKNLRNNLRPFYGPAVDALAEARLRAEEIHVEGFIELYERLG